jgi:tetratricopeptide (TPR) repeat protein
VQGSGSPATPFALIVLGVRDLKARPAAGLEELWSGYSQIRRPRLADDAGFDPAWAIAALRSSADRETDPERLLRHAAIFGETVRLQPLETRLGFDTAALLLRARRFEAAADRFLATGLSERAEPEERERSLLSAADACAEGGLQLRAAALYKEYTDLRPASNSAGLFHRASSLKKAGDAEGAMAGFEEYVRKAGPSGTYAGTALVEKAALLGAAERWTEALEAIDRVLKAREVATAPDKDDWAQALLARGRALQIEVVPPGRGHCVSFSSLRADSGTSANLAFWLNCSARI